MGWNRTLELKKKQGVIYGLWHEDLVILISKNWFKNVCTLASKSRDGEMITRFLTKLGFVVYRGSSSRNGGAALHGMIKYLHSHKTDAAVTIDGPRGPRREVKLGILKLAQMTQRAIVPSVAVTSWKIILKKTWDQTVIPLPFSPTVTYYGDPLYVPEGIENDDLSSFQLELKKALCELKEKAERELSELTPLSFWKNFVLQLFRIERASP